MKDGMGFNRFDTKFGHEMADRPESTWTVRQSYAIWRTIGKYREQLATAGIDYDQIAVPEKPADPVRKVDLTEDSAAFVLTFLYNPDIVARVKDVPGRQWVPQQKAWVIAARHDAIEPISQIVTDYNFDISDAAAALAEKTLAEFNRRLEHSRAADADIQLPGLADELFPFQKAGVRYALDTKRCFIADEMGLGKTVQAIATVHAAKAYPALVIVPASLKLNWEREIKRWVPDAHVAVLERDSWMLRQDTPNLFVVINYDILAKKWLETLSKFPFRALVLDESHYLKNHKAQRTKAVKDLAKKIEYRLALSGTPLLNRPSELISQLQILGRLNEMGGFYVFAKRYCGMQDGMFGFDMSGATNLDELNRNMRALCYVRRNKAQVLKELPPKRRETVTLEIDNRDEYEAAAGDIIGWLMEHGGEEAATAAEQAEQLVRIERLKQIAMQGKLANAVDWIERFLDSGEKLVIFAHHRVALQSLLKEFPNAARLFGEDAMDARQSSVDRFQNDPDCRLFISSLRAGGVGITLTAASNVAFMEYGWTPAEHDQAEDRCHRIGQHDSVTAWYLNGENTIDEDIQALIAAKRKVVDAATEGDRKRINNNIVGDLIKRLRKKTQGGTKK